MKTTEIITITYKVELTKEEQKKFSAIPYGWDAKRNDTEIAYLSNLAWNRADSWKPLSDPFYLNKEEYKALTEYLSK